MWRQFLISSALTAVAATLDLAMPVWVDAAWRASFLEVALLLICLTVPGGFAVFFAGLLGLISDQLQMAPLGTGVMVFSTAAVLWAALRTEDELDAHWLVRLLVCLLFLGAVHLGRVSAHVAVAERAMPRLQSEFLIGLVPTLILGSAAFVVCHLFVTPRERPWRSRLPREQFLMR